jgi:hypothetical protein
MISQFTPPGIQVVALRTGFEIVAGRLYTVRGFVINRHWRTGEPDPHVLLVEVSRPRGWLGEVGYPRDAFEIPDIVVLLNRAAELLDAMEAA